MKLLKIFFVSLLVLLAACSNSDNLTIDLEEEIHFKKGEKSPVIIRVTDEEGPAENLQITGSFQMVNMDHGTLEAEFIESDEGIYSADVDFAMPGDWEVVFTIKKDGKTIEKVIEYEVHESQGVATINGEWITEDDMEFYRFINKLHIAINREKDKSQLEGQELETALAYWDNQEQLNENQNTLLTQIIRLRAMALLGAEKGHTASEDEILLALENIQEQYEEHDIAQKMIEEFGEEKFWHKEKQQYEMIILTQKVQTDLINEVRKENPEVNEQEIMYLAQKEYEDLLVSQVNSLEIKIM